jgi:predicted Co/Zn/Cd cation transporter (cation efflux family)
MRSTTWMAVLPASPGTFATFSGLLVVMLLIVAIFIKIAQYETQFQYQKAIIEPSKLLF